MKVLVVNCGSSSVKYSLFEMETEKKTAWGIVECIGLAEAYYIRQSIGRNEKKDSVKASNHAEAVELVINELLDKENGIFYYSKGGGENSSARSGAYSCNIDGTNEKFIVGGDINIFMEDDKLYFSQSVPKDDTSNKTANSVSLYIFSNNKLKKITALESKYVNIYNAKYYDGWYYINIGSPVPDGYMGELYRIKPDGTGLKKIDDIDSGDFDIIKGYIYYNDSGGAKYYTRNYSKKAKLDGSNIESIENEGGEVFYTDSKYMYRFGYEIECAYISRTDLKSNNQEILLETIQNRNDKAIVETDLFYATVFNGWIYYAYEEFGEYSVLNECYYRMKLDGTNNELLKIINIDK